ncbi:MAG: S49 family peptidase [Paracoccaceae bacterium]
MRILPKRKPSVAVIRLNGVIGGGRGLGGAGLSDATLKPVIEAAFKKKPVAVALAINSPGGSPAQSALIAARIRRMADEAKIPVIAFCEDVAASGGYWLATAGDEIFADDSSILGSIGVISAGFGLQELIGKIGVERRMYTAGESKSMLDPFQPEKPEDLEKMDVMLKAIHENFKAQVRARRGARLKEDGLFTGAIFVGRAAVENGLIDGIGHLEPVMKARFGDKLRFVEQKVKRGLLSRFGITGADAAPEAMLEALESRAIWARFGL